VKLGASVIRALKTALNTVFSTYLNDDGTFKNNVVTGAALVDATVAKAKLASDVYPVLQAPTGTVTMFAGSAAPTNYVLCDGSNYDGTNPTYAALFAVIGTTYGNSGGASHFNVPDLRGRVAVGLDGGASRTPTITTLGATDGAATHLLTAAESGLPDHTHDMVPDWVKYSGGGQALGSSGAQGDGGNVTGSVHSGAQPAASAHQNLQPSIGLNYIIRL
jgi:microcystin-dependent protein